MNHQIIPLAHHVQRNHRRQAGIHLALLLTLHRRLLLDLQQRLHFSFKRSGTRAWVCLAQGRTFNFSCVFRQSGLLHLHFLLLLLYYLLFLWFFYLLSSRWQLGIALPLSRNNFFRNLFLKFGLIIRFCHFGRSHSFFHDWWLNHRCLLYLFVLHKSYFLFELL